MHAVDSSLKTASERLERIERAVGCTAGSADGCAHGPPNGTADARFTR